MFFKVDFSKAYDSVRWDYLLDVLEAFGFGHTWCKWIQGTLSSAKASILVNGSPSKEFSYHRGLKQGDPLAPYLFILVMEPLHISFSRAVEEGLFKGIFLSNSISISHLFYADDTMFLGEWSDSILQCIINILKSFFLAFGLQINIFKSQLLGVGVPRSVVEQAVSSIGCSILSNQFRYLGVMVKTLSIGGRLTLLKSVLGASPIYNMSIFKVPRGVLKVMEAIRVSSFCALNRALLLKWVWRFVSQDGSFWYKTIRALYGSSVESHPTHLSSNWCSVVRELHHLKEKGFDFWSHCKKRIRNGINTRFWFDCWIGDVPLHAKFPRLYALELDKDASVAVKLSAPVDISFRRRARGGLEQHLMAEMVKEVRNFIDDLFLPSHPDSTRWVKSIPIKINIFTWRARRDCLPTRANLVRRDSQGPRSRSGRPGFLRSASHPRLNLYWRVFFRLLGCRFGGSGIGPSLRRILLDVRSFLMT
uniref:RNA-directed DNA polymerase, eukaryota, reverse transcriptase zinc-binding domain protein n=1 Tax=Tanacetum cinerariifolium TaxID=118510 RepID=A0A699HBF3_TANCI|nr:RNA-directed DNA polymerase, eukaryota, reverse transcriptase zinc-binding domain protein [Tanacetum cinerariifolium]